MSVEQKVWELVEKFGARTDHPGEGLEARRLIAMRDQVLLALA